MFKKLFVLLLVLLFSVNFIFADKQDSEKNINQIQQDVLKYAVQFEIRTPKRSGRDAMGYFSGFAILEHANQFEDINGKVIKYISYFIVSLPHVISDEEWDLKDYQKNDVRIYVLGKDDKVAPARIIAWEWDTPALLLQVDILEKELKDFQIKKVEKIAKKLPTPSHESRYSDKAFDTVVFTGYPFGLMRGEPIANPGYFFNYYYNYYPRYYTLLTKVATANIFGHSGGGQSGGPVFNLDKEVVGVHWGGPQYSGSNFSIVIPIDVIVERFLKQLLELKDLDLPNFELEERIKNKPVNIMRPEDKENKN